MLCLIDSSKFNFDINNIPWRYDFLYSFGSCSSVFSFLINDVLIGSGFVRIVACPISSNGLYMFWRFSLFMLVSTRPSWRPTWPLALPNRLPCVQCRLSARYHRATPQHTW